MADNEVKIVITGHDASGSKTLRGVREEADRASHSFGGLKTAVGLASGALAGMSVGAGLVSAVKSAAALEQAVANISTIKPELNTSAVFASLNEMQRRVPQSASQLASSLYDIFSSMDVGQDAALRLVETFAKGATAASTDAQTFGTAIMGVMNAYGASAADAAHISDVFFNTVNKGVVTGQELAASLGPVTQSAKAAGVSIEELGAMIAGVTKEGGPAAQNINNLNNFLAKVSTKDARDEIAKLGVATVDSAGNFRPIVDVLSDLKPRLEKMTEAQRANALQAIFPDAQARQGAMTLLSQLGAVKDALAANRESSGSTEAAYAKMSATMNAQMTILKNTVMSVLTEIGAAVLPHLTPLITAFAQRVPEALTLGRAALGAVSPVLREVGATLAGLWREDIAPKVAAFAAVFQGQVLPAVQQAAAALRDQLQPVVERVLTFLSEHKEVLAGVAVAIGTLLVAAFTAWAVSAGAAAAATIAAAAPVIAIGAAIAGVTAGVIYLVKNWDELTAKYPALASAAAAVSDALIASWDFIRGQLDAFVAWWSGIWPSVQEAAEHVWNAIRTVAEATVAVLTAAWRVAGDDIIAILRAFWEFASTTFENVKAVVQNAVELVVNLINGDWSAAWENAKAIVRAVVDQVIAYVIELPAQVAAPLLDLAGKFLGWIKDDVLPKLPGALTTIVTAIGRWLWDTAVPWAGEQLSHLGEAIVNGIKAGVLRVWDSFTGWLSEQLGKLPGPLKGALGISSPSRVMAEQVGVPIVQGIMAGIESKLPDLERQLRDVGAAIARARLDLAAAPAGSAAAAALDRDLKVLTAWQKQIKDQITVEKEWQQSLLDAATALDYFNNQMGQIFSGSAQRRLFGAEGADIIQSLLDAIEDPTAGARVAEGLGRLLSSDAFKRLPGAAALGAQLTDAIFGALATGTPEAFAAVTTLLAGMQAQFDAAGTLSGTSFGDAFGRAMAAEDNLNRFGQAGAQLIDAFATAIDRGGGAAIEKAGQLAAGLMDELRDKLPPKAAGRIGTQLFAAFQRAAEEKTPEALDQLKAFVEQTNDIFGMIPRNMRDLVPELQAAILAIIDLFREGAISAEEAGKRINAAIEASEEKAREAKKKADESKRGQSASRDAEKGAPQSESNANIDTGGPDAGTSITTRTNAGGIAGFTHSTMKQGNWQVEVFAATAELIAVSSEFLRIAKAWPAGTTPAQAMGFKSQSTFDAWDTAIKAAAAQTALRWDAARSEAGGTWGGGALGAMGEGEFEQFLGSLPASERERARQERERAQRDQAATAGAQQQAADDQGEAAQDNKWSAAQGKENEAGFKKDVEDLGEKIDAMPTPEDWAQAQQDAADEGGDRADDEDERRRRRKRKEEEDTGAVPAVPAHAEGGVISEFARLVNSAGQTIGTMAEAGPEAILPLGLLGRAAAVMGDAVGGSSGLQTSFGGAGISVLIGAVAAGVAQGLGGAIVQMDGREVGRLVTPYVSADLGRDALLAGIDR